MNKREYWMNHEPPPSTTVEEPLFETAIAGEMAYGNLYLPGHPLAIRVGEWNRHTLKGVAEREAVYKRLHDALACWGDGEDRTWVTLIALGIRPCWLEGPGLVRTRPLSAKEQRRIEDNLLVVKPAPGLSPRTYVASGPMPDHLIETIDHAWKEEGERINGNTHAWG